MSGTKVTLTCLTCGEESLRYQRRDRELKYCSVKCRGIAKRKSFDIPKPVVINYSCKTKLINGRIIVDAEWFEYLNQFSWYTSDTGYAIRTYRCKHIRMHHEVIGKPMKPLMVDHKNRNKLDNRMSNLRIVTASENSRNGSGIVKLLYPDLPVGMTFDKSRQKFLVRKPQLKRFSTLNEAMEYYETNTKACYVHVQEGGLTS